MSRFAPAILLVCCVWAAEKPNKKPITLEALATERAATVPGDPVWAPDGSRFVYNEGGTLRLYDVAMHTCRDLAALSSMERAAAKIPAAAGFAFENRRVSDQNIQWFPSGRELLISASGDLFRFRVDAGGWTQLTATPVAERDPKLSPDGTRISFRREHDLYVLEIASLRITRLTEDGSATLLNGELDWVYPEELDLGSAQWWSPDSKSIAYLQFDISREHCYPQADLVKLPAVAEPQRYPKPGDANADVRLGVVSASGGRTAWMNVGETRDALLARVFWFPDSASLAVERLNRTQNRLELVGADARTGASHTLLSETDPNWVNVTDQVQFLKGGKEFLWTSERDGYRHLYRYSATGELLAQITRGEWQVSSVACVDESSGDVFYLSTEASPLESQLYAARLDGSGRRRLTTGAGTHGVSIAPRCETYLDTFSNLTTPPRRTLHGRDGREIAVFAEADRKLLEAYAVAPAEIVEVKASDGALLYGRLTRPAGFERNRKYPVVVDVYGGPQAQSVSNRWYGTMSVEQVLAARGFIVWSLDGRGTAQRGHRWETAVARNLGAKELEDQKEGIRHLLSLGFADPKRIGIHGWSYGGFMTAYSLLHAPDVFACGVAGAPVTDWRNYDTIYTERYMGLPSENAQGYDTASLVGAAAKLQGRLLLVHNLEDDNVLFQNSVRLAEALERADKQFELMVYTNHTHGLVAGRHHFERLLVEFFERNLK
ncbi:MAG TPA: S9 family peptidase [Bryobacteraceae bacterium]|nr:S9 family peptidase [Bryobacteraceae bacterium]